MSNGYVCEYTVDLENPEGDDAACREPAEASPYGPRCQTHLECERKADHVADLFASYQRKFSSGDEGTAMEDLLGDLEHFARRRGIDFAAAADVARRHVRSEIKGDDDLFCTPMSPVDVKASVVVELAGGVCQAARANICGVEVTVIDYDQWNEGDEQDRRAFGEQFIDTGVLRRFGEDNLEVDEQRWPVVVW